MTPTEENPDETRGAQGVGDRASAAAASGDWELLTEHLLQLAVDAGDASVLVPVLEAEARGEGESLLSGHAQLLVGLPRSVLRETAVALSAFRLGAPVHPLRQLVRQLAGEQPGVAARLASGLAWSLAEQGMWAKAEDFVEIAFLCVGVGPARMDSWFDAQAAAVLVEWNTFSGSVAFEVLRAELAGPRASNRLRAHHARALIAVGRVLAGRQEFGGAAVSLARALRVIPATDFITRVMTRAELAFVRYRHGDWRGARVDSAAIVSDVQAAVSPRLRSVRAAVSAIWPALNGDVELAHRLADEARGALVMHPSVTAEIVLLHARIALVIGANQWESMLRLLEEASEQGYRRMYSEQEWLALWAIPLRNSGAIDRYREHVRAWSEHSESVGVPYYWAHVGLLAQIDGDGPRALDAAGRAHAAVSRNDDPLGRGWTRIVVGTLTALYGDPITGMNSYETARAEFNDLDAQGFVRLCTEILQATSRQLAERTQEPLAPLTEQQRRIAGLVADGYTSAEIAQMLYLSKKTIDFHVANIVSRLGLASRRDIRRLFRR